MHYCIISHCLVEAPRLCWDTCPASSQRASQSLLAFQSPQHKLKIMGHEIQNMPTAHQPIQAQILTSSCKNNVLFQKSRCKKNNPPIHFRCCTLLLSRLLFWRCFLLLLSVATELQLLVVEWAVRHHHHRHHHPLPAGTHRNGKSSIK